MSPVPKVTRREFLEAAAAVVAERQLHAATRSREAESLRVSSLRCEYAENPLGIDILAPRLSWQLGSSHRNVQQTAYQVLVASTRERLVAGQGNLWNSGKVADSNSGQIAYAGKNLSSRARCFWSVRVWDQRHMPSDWSSPASWEMALVDPADWRAKWIGAGEVPSADLTYTPPSPYFRKTFQLPRAAASARVYISGLGFYELYLNGTRIGDHVLSPSQTNFDRRDLRRLIYPFDDKTSQRVSYCTYDVTEHLQPGKNVIGVILGNGWYNQRDRNAEGYMWYGNPRLLAQTEVTFADGSRDTIVSDETWKVSTNGPIVHNGIFTGEIYDARKEMEGWSQASFNDADWYPAYPMRAPTGRLIAQVSPPDRILQTIVPVSSTQINPQTTRFDFGQNLAGWVRLKVQGPAGASIPMNFIEDNGPSYHQTDTYILKGTGLEVYEPRFTWHGFRQAEIGAPPDLISRATVEARVIHTDVQPTGSFTCSNGLFNQIFHNAIWSQQSNMHCGVPSDCPHRERVGYTADGHLAAEAAIYNFDMARFYTKWIDDMADAQNRDTGFVPHSAPFEGGGGGPPWGSGYVVMPWLIYLYYGDRRILEKHYAGMTRWIEYLKSRTDKDGIVTHEEPGSWDLGEWATPGKVEIPRNFVNTCYYAYVAQLTAKSAQALGKSNDVSYFNGIAHAAGNAVHRQFFDAEKKQYWTGRQGANVFPLAFDLVPAEHKKAVFDRMVGIILNDNRGHFDTGIFGTRFVLDLLTANGRGDVAYAMMNQQTFPSFGWQIARGATTLWENWNEEGSHNHAMYSSICTWFYRSLAGIKPDPAQPGFKHVAIEPHLLGDLTYVDAKHRSMHGEIASAWTKSSDGFELRLAIPAGSTATILLPSANASKIQEGGKSLAKTAHVRILLPVRGRVACAVGSGRYEFHVDEPSAI